MIYPKIRESIIFKRETLEIFCGRCDYCSQFFTPSSATVGGTYIPTPFTLGLDTWLYSVSGCEK